MATLDATAPTSARPTSTGWRRRASASPSSIPPIRSARPARAALLTGRYPTRVGVPNVIMAPDKTGLSRRKPRSPHLLKAAGLQDHVRRQVAPRPSAAVPAHQPRLRRILRHPLFSNDMTPRPLMHNTEVLEEPAVLETLTPRYTAAGASIHRAIQGLALLPLHAAHLPAYPAGGLAALPRQVASGPVRRRGGGTRLERRRGAGQTQADGPRQSHARDVLLRQRALVSGQSRSVCAAAKAPPTKAACASRSWRASPAASRAERSAAASPAPSI